MGQLMNQILSRENMKMAYKKVKANKGAGGIDGISIEDVNKYLKENWIDIKTKILKRKYKPQPVLRVEIPKPNGGVRNLGIPTDSRQNHRTSNCPSSNTNVRATI